MIRFLLPQKASDEGFTLVEMLVVIIIIGILSAIALPSFLNQANKARESEAASYVGAMNRAQQAHYVEQAQFGSNLEALDLGISNTGNYTYEVEVDPLESAVSLAKPAGQLKGYGGRVWLQVTDGGRVTKSVVCAGTAGQLPANITGIASTATACPGDVPPVVEEVTQIGRAHV